MKGSVHKPVNVHKVSFEKTAFKVFISLIEHILANSEHFIEIKIPFDSDYDTDYGNVFRIL